MNIPNVLLDALADLPRPTLIGISGFGGAGKTTFAQNLGAYVNAPVVGVDSFQTKGAFTTEYSLWRIMDFPRLEHEVLIPFLAGNTSIQYGHFDPGPEMITENRTITHNGILIVEGVGLFRPELMHYFTYTIWLDCPMEIAIARGKWRDREIHHNPTDALWDGVWRRNDLEYLDTYTPEKKAHIVLKTT
jgi:uridine kinase